MLSVRGILRARNRILVTAIGVAASVTLLVAVPGQAGAQSAFAGVFLGNLSVSNGSVINDRLGIFLNTDGTAVFGIDVRIITFDSGSTSSTDIAFLNKNVNVNPDGSFSNGNIDGQGTFFSGQFTGTGVNGSFSTSNGVNGTFSATRSESVGFLRNSAGFYEGPMSGVESFEGVIVDSFSGTFSAIIDADGKGYAFESSSGSGGSRKIGGEITVSSDNSIQASLRLVDYVGTLDTSTNIASGTLSLAIAGIEQSGVWSASRRISLPNSRPLASPDSYSMFANRALTVDASFGVLSNDSDLDGDPLTAAVATSPANGTLALAADGGFTYTPDKGFSGVDSFTYRASDGLTTSNLATVTITVEAIKAMPWLSLLLD